MKRLFHWERAKRVARAPLTVIESFGGIGSYLRELAVSRNFYVAILLYGLFFIAEHILPFDSLFLTETFILICVETLLLLVYLPAALRAMVRRPITSYDALLLGIFLAWSANLGRNIISLFYRYSDNSEWILTSAWISFLAFNLLVAGSLHITAPDTDEGRVAPMTWFKLISAAAFGALVASVAIYLFAGKALLMTNP